MLPLACDIALLVKDKRERERERATERIFAVREGGREQQVLCKQRDELDAVGRETIWIGHQRQRNTILWIS